LHCLQANAAALSPPCRNAVMAIGEAGAPPAASAPPAPLGPIPPMRPRKALEVLSFCGAEQRTLCANVPPGGGRISNAWRQTTRACHRSVTARSRARRDSFDGC
jgi:hypothetical protein